MKKRIEDTPKGVSSPPTKAHRPCGQQEKNKRRGGRRGPTSPPLPLLSPPQSFITPGRAVARPDSTRGVV